MMTTGKRLYTKVKPYAVLIRGIAHPQRLAIAYLLAHEPMEVRFLVDYLNIAENLISHHLKVMYAAGWVRKTKIGRNVTYELNTKPFAHWLKLFAGTPFGREKLEKKEKD